MYGSPHPKKVYADVAAEISRMVDMVNPTKEIFIAIDGVAGMAKIIQQRQRRYKSSLSPLDNFNTTCISPGTEFLNGLSKYLTIYIKRKKEWSHLKVIFSSERVAGEGEEKCFRYFRKHPEYTHLIYGSDADLIMYSLLNPTLKIYILRDDHYNRARMNLVNMVTFIQDMKMPPADFAFVCCLIGNDFLPAIPNVEVFNGGMEQLFSIYKGVGQTFVKPDMTFNRKPIKAFLLELSKYQREWLNYKLLSDDYFSDANIEESQGCFTKFKSLYYNTKLKDVDPIKAAKQYLKGVQWVMLYYSKGMPDWSWFYPYQYSPFLCDLVKAISDQPTIEFNKTSRPLQPLQQLLLIIPPASRELLPAPLASLLEDESPIKHFYPTKFDIDLSGKRREWQGIPILPSIDISQVILEFNKRIGLVDEATTRRTRPGKVFMFNEC
jgi:5'-3' exoribonuclease 1